MIPVLMAVCLLTGLLVGLRGGARWRRALRRQLAEERSRIDMWNSNALATDHDVIGGPVTPAKGTVELFDGARLAETRDDHVCTYGSAGAGCNDPVPDRPCNACGRPAVFAWETDGFPFAACNLCVELWFPDGLPDHVVRLVEPEVVAEGPVWCAKSVEGWCAVVPDVCPEEGTDWVETVCRVGIMLPGGYDHRRPDCPDCVAMFEAHPLRRWSDAVRSPGPVDDDTSDMRSLPHRRVD